MTSVRFAAPGAHFTKHPLERTSFNKGRSFLFLCESKLKIQFHKASFKSPSQRSSLKLKVKANVPKFGKHALKDTPLNLR